MLESEVEAATGELSKVNAQLVLARDRYRQTSERKSDFISSISHELRTPLTSIKGAVRYLTERFAEKSGGELPPREELAPFIEIISRIKTYETSPPSGDWRRRMSFVASEGRFGPIIDRMIESYAVNMLSERRAALAQRRDRLYEEIGKLEQRESDLLKQGRENKSTVTRRRLAAQDAQLRKDIARQNTTARMLNQQINIISTDIHNLTLIQQGQVASLPDANELTENAVRAEEMLGGQGKGKGKKGRRGRR